MSSLTRWQIPELTWPALGRLTDLRDEIDRLFGAPLSAIARSAQLVSGWVPPIELFEEKDNFVLRAELPGMKKEEIDVSIHDGSLSISGERRTESKESEVYRAERFFGRFERTVALPSPVAVEKVKAHYADGILTVTLPKSEEAKPKHINVSAS